MPGSKDERDGGAGEGVVINDGWGPEEIVVEDGKSKVEGEAGGSVFDEEGRFSPVLRVSHV